MTIYCVLDSGQDAPCKAYHGGIRDTWCVTNALRPVSRVIADLLGVLRLLGCSISQPIAQPSELLTD
jgi:hypothetical protein